MSKHPIIIWRAEDAPVGFQKEEVKWIAVLPRSMQAHYVAFIDQNPWFLRYCYEVISSASAFAGAREDAQRDNDEADVDEHFGEEGAETTGQATGRHYQYVWNFGSSVRPVAEADLARAILVWKFEDAPKEYKQLGGIERDDDECHDRDWLVFVPMGFLPADDRHSFIAGDFGPVKDIDWIDPLGMDLTVHAVDRGCCVLVAR